MIVSAIWCIQALIDFFKDYIHILHTALLTLPMIWTWRMCLRIRSFLSQGLFPSFS